MAGTDPVSGGWRPTEEDLDAARVEDSDRRIEAQKARQTEAQKARDAETKKRRRAEPQTEAWSAHERQAAKTARCALCIWLTQRKYDAGGHVDRWEKRSLGDGWTAIAEWEGADLGHGVYLARVDLALQCTARGIPAHLVMTVNMHGCTREALKMFTTQLGAALEAIEMATVVVGANERLAAARRT